MQQDPFDSAKPAGVQHSSPRTGLDVAPPVGMEDKDGAGLPPSVILPDPAVYRRDQWKARLVVCGVVLAILLGFLWFATDHRALYAGCTALVGLTFLIALVNYLRARGKVAASEAKAGQFEP